MKLMFVSLNELQCLQPCLWYLPLHIVSFYLLHFRYQKDALCQEGTMLLRHGQVPFCCSLMFKKFLSLSNHSIIVCVKRKRINRGVGYGLEFPVEYIFCGNEKAIQWAKRTLDAVDGNAKKGLRYLKQSHFEKKNLLFLTCVLLSLACPLLGGNFHRDNLNRTWTFCPLMRGVRYFRVFCKGFVLIFCDLLTFVYYLEVPAIQDAC